MKVTAILYSRPLSNGKHQIKIRLFENGKTTYKTTKYSVEYNKWDFQKDKVKELKSIPEHETINDEINRLVKLYKREYPEDTRVSKPYDLFIYLREFDKEIKHLKSQQKYNTYRKYEVVKRHLVNFNDKNPEFICINLDFLNNFQMYLFETIKLKQNGVHSYFKVFRNVLNKVIVSNNPDFRIEFNPFLHFNVKEEKVFKPKLTIEQLNKIKEHEFKEGSMAWHVKNYFLFSFYSGGMRVGDLITLQWRNILDDRLEYTMGKTKKPISLILNQNQIEILLLYFPITELENLKKEKTILTDFTRLYKDNQELNKFKESLETKPKNNILKQLQLKRGDEFIFPILKKSKFKEFESTTAFLKSISSKTAIINKELKEISKECEIGTKISFHIARHTFSDLMRKKGIGIYDISKILGHSDIGTTQKYLKSIDHETMDSSLSSFYNDL
jgi:integrase